MAANWTDHMGSSNDLTSSSMCSMASSPILPRAVTAAARTTGCFSYSISATLTAFSTDGVDNSASLPNPRLAAATTCGAGSSRSSTILASKFVMAPVSLSAFMQATLTSQSGDFKPSARDAAQLLALAPNLPRAKAAAQAGFRSAADACWTTPALYSTAGDLSSDVSCRSFSTTEIFESALSPMAPSARHAAVFTPTVSEERN
mmetsp:Transcript_27469/g.72325  ORF Transcript_27469/g.72325 Transcript_27469/m.72325 type:complete len:203 (+) Transcript_27469:413-1021(+)